MGVTSYIIQLNNVMKTQIYKGLTALMVLASSIAYGQQNNDNNRYRNDDRNYDNRSSRYDDERDYRNDRQDRDNRNDDRQRRDDDMRRRDDDRRRQDDDRDQRSTDSDRYRSDSRTFRRYEDRDLQQAYDKGYDDGMNDVEKNKRKERKENYKNFAFGVYGGLNSTFLAGESLNGNNPQGRLGYQLGAYVRGGGRLFGQIGVEYLTSSSNIITKGDGTTKNLNDVINGVDQKYIHIPAYIGVKLAQSPKGVSAVRLQVGAELATVTSNQTEQTLNNSSVNGLANLGFDAGPLTIDFVYHYGFNNTIQNQAVSYKPRILGVNVGFKF